MKPANVLLDDDGNAYLSDFGIAEDLTDWREIIPPASLGYYSPEQLRGEEVTPASDIYGLGMVVQDVVNGRHGDVRVADVISRATADDPDSRYRDAGEVAVALREALDLPGPRPRAGDVQTEERNPYKGLHAFAEADADDFFGRDALVDRLVARMAESAEGSRFLAVVGPSGSGKSSVVRAGLIPTLRAGALPGSDSWFYVEMLPGGHPMEELEAALQRIAVDPPTACWTSWSGASGASSSWSSASCPTTGASWCSSSISSKRSSRWSRRNRPETSSCRASSPRRRTADSSPDRRHASGGLLRPSAVVPGPRRVDANPDGDHRAADGGGARAGDRRPGGSGSGSFPSSRSSRRWSRMCPIGRVRCRCCSTPSPSSSSADAAAP